MAFRSAFSREFFTVFCSGVSAEFQQFLFCIKLLTHIAYMFIPVPVYPRCLQQFTLVLAFNYLVGTFIVYVRAGFSYHTYE